MRFYKLRVTPNATRIASTFNGQFKPEIIAEYNDPYRVEWLDETCNEDVLIGDQASGHITRPFHVSLCNRPCVSQILNNQDILQSGLFIEITSTPEIILRYKYSSVILRFSFGKL